VNVQGQLFRQLGSHLILLARQEVRAPTLEVSVLEPKFQDPEVDEVDLSTS
jgi:hypothetical protein